jgi:hypothetical protein
MTERRYPTQTATLVGVLVVAFFGLVAPALADPGSPGLTRASEGVYVGTNENSGRAELGSGGAGGSTGGEAPSDGGAAVGDGTGLPFTGLLAPAMLVGGVIALAIGISMRPLARGQRA